MKKNFRILLYITSLCMLTLFGCRKESANNETTMYKGEIFELEGVVGEISDFFVAGNDLLVTTWEMDEGVEINQTRLYLANLDGSNLDEIMLDEGDKKKLIYNVSINSMKSIAILFSNYTEDEIQYEVVILDENKNEKNRINLNQLINIQSHSFVTEMLLVENDKVILGIDDRVTVINDVGEIEVDLQIDSNVIGIVQTVEGKVYCAGNNEEGAFVKILDLERKEWGNTIQLGSMFFEYPHSLMIDNQYEFCCRYEDGIYGYTTKYKEQKKLIDFTKSNIEDGMKLVPTQDEKMLGMENVGSKVLKLYHKVEKSEKNKKKTITLASTSPDNYEIKRQIISFNKNNDECEIEYIDYSQNEDPINSLNTDIVAGNIPDIIDLSGLSIENYVQKGLLTDLTPYFDKDSQISTEDIIESVRDAMEIDEKIYYVSPSFSVYTLIGKTEDVGDKSGWTFQELQCFAKERKGEKGVFLGKTKEDMLSIFEFTHISTFVDWKTGKCDFDSKEFKEILEFCNYGESDIKEMEVDESRIPELVQSGEVPLLNVTVGVEDIQFYQKLFGSDITFIGYPNDNKTGSYFVFDYCMGISSESELKEEAWEFLKFFMCKEYQGDSGSVITVPTRKDCFDLMLKRKSATETYTDEFGNVIEPVEEMKVLGNFQVKLEPLSEKEIEMYMELIDNTKTTGSYDDNVMKIVKEEAQAYFKGDKSIDETVEIIQKRVETYINEQR